MSFLFPRDGAHGAVPTDVPAVGRLEPRHNGHRDAPPRTASALGVGHYLPDEVVSNQAIAARIGVDHDWIVKRTGIRSRRRAAPEDRLTDVAARAAKHALNDAGVDAMDVDLV